MAAMDSTTPKSRVGLIGHCGFDSMGLSNMVLKAVPGTQVVSIHGEGDLAIEAEGGISLLLINRQVGGGFRQSSGVDLAAEVARRWPGVKSMVITNYDDVQEAAVAAGALRGFGKNDLGRANAMQQLRDALAAAVVTRS
jgi:DNA-binding NarL/FixJ family response regulator